MKIRTEESADHQAIHAVHAVSFPTAAEATLVDRLRQAGRLRISLVALEQGEIVGHVGFSPVTVEDAAEGIGLAPVAVLPAFQKRGIADRLIRDGLKACKGLGIGFVVVLGDPSYYSRFGFDSAATWGLRDEYGGGDAFQALQLRPGTIPKGGGLVRYAPEFAAFGEEGAD